MIEILKIYLLSALFCGATMFLIESSAEELASIKNYNLSINKLNRNIDKESISNHISLITRDGFSFPKPFKKYSFDYESEAHYYYLKTSLEISHKGLVLGPDQDKYLKAMNRFLYDTFDELKDLNDKFKEEHDYQWSLAEHNEYSSIEASSVNYFCSLARLYIKYKIIIKKIESEAFHPYKKFYDISYGFCSN